jgi:ABC-type transport system involved in multi-copper enzyme maturation permease subunit
MDARYVHPHVVRAAFAMFMLFCLSMAALDTFGTNRTGLVFFGLVCQLNILLIAAAGVSYFVTAVSEEKDAGTFALLQLAGLTPLAITLGKSTSRLISSLMLLVSQIPFTFLAVTLGGIRWQQVLGAWVCLAAWMILIANMAVLCSARCNTSARAAGAAGVILLLWFGTPPTIRTILQAIAPGTLAPEVQKTLARFPQILELVSPWKQIDLILNQWEVAEVFGSQFWFSLLLAVGCFTVSTLRLNAWTRPTEDGAAGQEQGGQRRWPVGRCWRLPLAWRDFHFFAGGRTLFAARWLGWLIVYLAFLGVQKMELNSWRWILVGNFAMQMLLLLAGVLTLECVLLATGSLHSELRQMTHSSLAMLPLSSTRMFLEKSAGCAPVCAPHRNLAHHPVTAQPQQPCQQNRWESLTHVGSPAYLQHPRSNSLFTLHSLGRIPTHAACVLRRLLRDRRTYSAHSLHRGNAGKNPQYSELAPTCMGHHHLLDLGPAAAPNPALDPRTLDRARQKVAFNCLAAHVARVSR